MKEGVHKCRSDPGSTAEATAARLEARRRAQTAPSGKKCVLTLDGYSYVIVASPPERTGGGGGGGAAGQAGERRGNSSPPPPAYTSTPGEEPAELRQTNHMDRANGQMKKSEGSLTIVRRSSGKKSSSTTSGSSSEYSGRSEVCTPHSPGSRSSDDPLLDHVDLGTESLPPADTPDACDKAALRLRALLRQLQHGEISAELLSKNLLFAVKVLETVYIDETKRLADEEDELSEVQPDAVPPEVREWLTATFTRQVGPTKRRSEEKPKFKSVAHAIRAGIFVDRIYRRVTSTALMQFPPNVVKVLKTLDDWSFDVFALCEATNRQPIKYLSYDLLNRYGIFHKFKMVPATLDNFLTKIEEGYCKFRNPYHNNLHATDVAQTVHYMLCQTGLMNWLTDLEIFATLLAALIHDFEHTGTTNNFHVMSGTDTALLYNDRAVLENHHISAAFRLLKEEDCNILASLSIDEYREFRSLVIDMVLATDMSFHFQQLKNMKSIISLGETNVDKAKVLSLVLHCSDISHPAKRWDLHHRWTSRLLEEFFRQGDMERELGLPFSPLCDRNNTMVAESQIGFIDFIVDPSMGVCADMLELILTPPAPPAVGAPPAGLNSTPVASVSAGLSPAKGEIGGTIKSESRATIKKPWIACLAENKRIWKEKALQESETKKKSKTDETEGTINEEEASHEPES